MKHFVFLAALATVLAPLAAAAQTAPPSVAGTWSLQFQLQPALKKGAKQCIVFTQTSSANGIYTGTWTEPTYPIAGYWIQKGAQLTIDGSDYANSETALMSGQELSPSAASLDNIADWLTDLSNNTITLTTYATAQLVRLKKCPAASDVRRGGLMVGA